jgi:nicotinamidase-related amidase
MKALLIVDMLNDFVNPDGALPVKGAQGLVENIKALKEKADVVVYANDAHAENDPEFKAWPRHCVKGEYGAQVVDALAPKNGALVLEKQDLSVFTNREADRRLREAGVDELYVTGVATEYCVRGATLDALAKGYKVNIVVDAIAGVDEIRLPEGTAVPETKGAVNRSLLEMGNAGAKPLYTAKALDEMVEND